MDRQHFIDILDEMGNDLRVWDNYRDFNVAIEESGGIVRFERGDGNVFLVYVSKKLNNWEKEFVKEIDNLVKQMKKKAKKNEKSN